MRVIISTQGKRLPPPNPSRPFLTFIPRTNRRSPGPPRSLHRRYLASFLFPVLVGAPRETRFRRHICG